MVTMVSCVPENIALFEGTSRIGNHGATEPPGMGQLYRRLQYVVRYGSTSIRCRYKQPVRYYGVQQNSTCWPIHPDANHGQPPIITVKFKLRRMTGGDIYRKSVSHHINEQDLRPITPADLS